MNKFEEIIKNFIYEKQQIKCEIAEIERQRIQIAQERNEKKANAKTIEVVAEISELGKKITDLGNQSQELQNKLDSKYLEVSSQVNTQINDLISQKMSEICKNEKIKNEKQNEVEKQEERNAKYQMQKQKFYNRYGRMPELSEKAKKENQAEDEQCKLNKVEIAKIEETIKILQGELSELEKKQKQFKNGNWTQLVKVEETCGEQDRQTEKVNAQEIEENKEFEAILNLVENIIEERKQETQNVEHFEQEEALELPFITEKTENNTIEKVEEIQPIEEIKLEEIEPIKEIYIEEKDIPKVEVEEIHIEEKEIPEVEIGEIQLEEIEPVEELQIEEKTIQEMQDIGIEEILEKKVEEIKQEEQEEKGKTLVFGDKVILISIIAKIEEGELVYKAEISNGKTIKIYPRNVQGQNLLLKENRKEIKEVLINYAIAEYKTLDQKITKKIDPIICEILTKFAKEYNYDAQNLIYNYAMSFDREEDIETDSIPQITYNVSYLETIKLSRKEKQIFKKICKNAKKNDKIEIIGYNIGINRIKYMFKKIFSINDTNALPEGKY